jgi:hypothetical protein
MIKTKTVYAYDKYTKEYIGEQNANLCPVTQTEYLMPVSSTEVKPSKHKDGFARVFVNGQWEYVEDKRGAVIYDCTTRVITGCIDTLVYTVPEGCTLEVPKKGDVWINNEWKPKPPPTVAELALIEISRLEAQVTIRRLIEAVTENNGWIAQQKALITIERNKL